MTFRALLRDQLRRVGKSIGLGAIEQQAGEAKMLTAKVLINQMKAQGVHGFIKEAEFKVFSQFGDDGIIQYLVHHIRIPTDQQAFIEFGVENYMEANTRFLLMNDNWRGLIIDSSAEYMNQVRSSNLYWRHDLTAVEAFIDRDNINALFREHGFVGEIGLLSVDIDGNDYWVWERIEAVNPVIVVVEYNSVFGWQHAVTVPYDSAFQRTRAHYSNLYWGCSLKALCLLGERKGYAFVGCNGAGNNAYFVRQDRMGRLKALTSDEGFVDANFRESRDRNGRLTALRGNDRLQEIRDLPIYDIETGKVANVGSLEGTGND